MVDRSQNSAGQKGAGIAGVFVARPVLALTINLLVIIAGLSALYGVEIRQLPNVSQPVLSVMAEFPGASANTVDAEVTSVLEDALARLEGLENISSTSRYGEASLTIEMNRSVDIVDAANDARDLVSRARRNLPDDLEDPIVQKSDPDADPILRLVLSGALELTELATLAEGLVTERLLTVEGVAEVQINGDYERIMRVTFSPVSLASRGISLDDMRAALASANLDVPMGALETRMQEIVVRSIASATTEDSVSAIRLNPETVIGDVAFVQFTSDDPTSTTRINGEPAVGLSIIRQTRASTLSVSNAVREAVATLRGELPDGAELTIVSDDGVFVERSIAGVATSIALASIIVVAVIFLFLRSARAVLVPAASVPVALIGTLAAIWLAGFSVNTITLLALVLATGIVVDDAIVVLENIVRRRHQGFGPYAAAAVGTRDVFFAVVSTTATLAAVFIPISFLPGQAGGIFGEFGFVLAFAVAISSFVALTLCPAICALVDPGGPGHETPERRSSIVAGFYDVFGRIIDATLRFRVPVLAGAFLFSIASLALYTVLPKEITPSEDRGTIFISMRSSPSASLEYTSQQVTRVEQLLRPFVEAGEVGAVQALIGRGGSNMAFVIVRLALWEDRARSQMEIASELQSLVRSVPGAVVALRSPNSLGIRGAGRGVQFAVVGTDYDILGELTDRLLVEMQDDPTFTDPQLVNSINQPELLLKINRDHAASIGIEPRQVVATLSTVIDGDSVSEIFVNNEAIDVRLEVGGRPVNDQGDIENVFLQAANGQLFPISSVAEFEISASAARLDREARERAVTAQANLGPGVDLGAAVDRLKEIAPPLLEPDGRLVLLGEAAALDSDKSITLVVFAASILIVFLVLSAQFESFASAFVILVTVLCGVGSALMAILLTGGSLNYYSQIGVVILVGIMAKNGVLIVEFANQLRQQGHSIDQAIRNAMEIRFRPVIMTLASTVAGSVPLVLAAGAGSEMRIAVGWVVVVGLGLSTAFTVFLTPAAYRVFASWDTPGATERRLRDEVSRLD